jgi:hypothetical protein
MLPQLVKWTWTIAHELKDKDQSPRRVLTMAHFEEAFKTTRPTVTESVMEPLSEFASEFDRLAFAAMQAFKNEESVIFYDHLKQSRSSQPFRHGIQTSQNEPAAEAGGTISSNITANVPQEEPCVNGGRHETSAEA